MPRLIPEAPKYSPEELKKHLDQAVISFDTSALLRLYNISPKARDQFIRVLRHVKAQLWLPYQVAIEFYKNRELVMADERQAPSAAVKQCSDMIKTLEDSLATYKKHEAVETKRIIGAVRTTLVQERKRLENLEAQQKKSPKPDVVLQAVERLFYGRVGDRIPAEELPALAQNAVIRGRLKIPPGYEDYPRSVGDIIIWYQLLRQAQATKKAIVFVTNDGKKDWWGKDDKDSDVPRSELVAEMAEVAGVPFILYSPDGFLDVAKSHWQIPDRAGNLKQAVEEIREDRESMQAEAAARTEIMARAARDMALDLETVAPRPRLEAALRMETLADELNSGIANPKWPNSVLLQSIEDMTPRLTALGALYSDDQLIGFNRMTEVARSQFEAMQASGFISWATEAAQGAFATGLVAGALGKTLGMDATASGFERLIPSGADVYDALDSAMRKPPKLLDAVDGAEEAPPPKRRRPRGNQKE